MRKTLLILTAAAALAAPAAAFACDGGHGQNGDNQKSGDVKASFMSVGKLTGTGTSFASTTATASGTGFSLSLSTTWSSAQSKTWTMHDNSFAISCAPATATLTLGTNPAASLTGKTCSTTHNGTTKYAFVGRSDTGVRAAFREDGPTVTGFAFAGLKPGEKHSFFHH